ncbi:hypothetical protein ABH931_005529 [Streptacidiphilus sp. MAP12-33]|uniref:hypothetical protein n=1 Tax=Streptacidiphilus sp. MAP12-33 TaxID=3156266 RepID=UPI0035117D7F
MSRARAAGWGLAVPGLLALAMSATTSYAYLGQRLGITWTVERGFLAVTGESAILALSVYAWATRTRGPARLALGAVLIQALPAYALSGGTGGTVRVILGPVLLAVVLHLLLGLEVRARGEHAAGLLGQALREARERLTAWLGIGRRGSDSAAIARSRAADRAVALADALAGANEGGWKARRLSARLAAAIDAAQHGLPADEAAAAEQHVVARVVRRRSVKGLARIEQQHTWSLAAAPRVAPEEPELPVYVTPDPAPLLPTQPSVAAPATRPRRATGKVPNAARTNPPKRTDAEVLDEARALTADWPDEKLTAAGIRKAVHVAQDRARELREQLKAERAARPSLHSVPAPDETDGITDEGAA